MGLFQGSLERTLDGAGKWGKGGGGQGSRGMKGDGIERDGLRHVGEHLFLLEKWWYESLLCMSLGMRFGVGFGCWMLRNSIG